VEERSSLEHPPLGLVIVIAAILSLRTTLSLLTEIVARQLWSVGVIDSSLEVVVLAVQAWAGWAILRRRHARLAVGCYAATVMLAALVAAITAQSYAWLFASVFELLGPPVFVIAASRWFLVTSLSTSRERAAGGVLLAIGLNAYLSVTIQLIQSASRFLHGDAIRVAFSMLGTVIILGIGTFAFIAGVRIAQGRNARRMLLLYVVLGVAGRVALDAIFTGLAIGVYGGFDAAVMVPRYVETAGAIALPLILWAYAKPELDGVNDARGGAALPWAALWIAPILIAQCFDAPELGLRIGGWSAAAIAVGCGLLAIGFVAAAAATLRNRRSLGFWITSLVLASLLLGYGWRVSDVTEFLPLSMLIAIAAVGAWLHRGKHP